MMPKRASLADLVGVVVGLVRREGNALRDADGAGEEGLRGEEGEEGEEDRDCKVVEKSRVCGWE